jgi:hypothetical protein
VRKREHRFQIVIRPDRRQQVAPVRAGWILTALVLIFGMFWFRRGELEEGWRGISGLEMVAWVYLPCVIFLSGQAVCRGVCRSGLLLVLGGPLLLYGAALAGFRNSWVDPSFAQEAAQLPVLEKDHPIQIRNRITKQTARESAIAARANVTAQR